MFIGRKESATLTVTSDSSATLVIATFNRPGSVATLLGDLRAQVGGHIFDVLVVNDGGSADVAKEIPQDLSFGVRLINRENGGPAQARHTGISASDAPVIIILDDDMRVDETFVAAHLEAHAGGAEVVFGLITSSAGARVPLFTAFHDQHIDRWLEACELGEAPRGELLCTGNVSFRRDVYLEVGGFDLTLQRLEDRDLGIRLQAAGHSFGFAKAAVSTHVSDHSDVGVWRARSRTYGESDLAISKKYPARSDLSPWAFLNELPKITHPILVGVTMFPSAAKFLGSFTYQIAKFASRVGVMSGAMKLTGFTYGIDYYAGVGTGWGGAQQSLSELKKWFRKGGRS